MLKSSKRLVDPLTLHYKDEDENATETKMVSQLILNIGVKMIISSFLQFIILNVF